MTQRSPRIRARMRARRTSGEAAQIRRGWYRRWRRRFGPWQIEPDHFEFDAFGYHCVATRNMQLGNWCGYLLVPTGHPWYGSYLPEADIHGGVTLGAEKDGHWYIGFDCAHLGDTTPCFGRRLGQGTYRGLEFVHMELLGMAARAAEAAKMAEGQ